MFSFSSEMLTIARPLTIRIEIMAGLLPPARDGAGLGGQFEYWRVRTCRFARAGPGLVLRIIGNEAILPLGHHRRVRGIPVTWQIGQLLQTATGHLIKCGAFLVTAHRTMLNRLALIFILFMALPPGAFWILAVTAIGRHPPRPNPRGNGSHGSGGCGRLPGR